MKKLFKGHSLIDAIKNEEVPDPVPEYVVYVEPSAIFSTQSATMLVSSQVLRAPENRKGGKFLNSACQVAKYDHFGHRCSDSIFNETRKDKYPAQADYFLSRESSVVTLTPVSAEEHDSTPSIELLKIDWSGHKVMRCFELEKFLNYQTKQIIDIRL